MLAISIYGLVMEFDWIVAEANFFWGGGVADACFFRDSIPSLTKGSHICYCFMTSVLG